MDSRNPPAQRAVVLVYSRSVEAGADRGLETGLNKGSSVSARLVVPSNQAGCLLGKGGVIISEMRKATGASIHILKGDHLPKCVAQDDEVVEVICPFFKKSTVESQSVGLYYDGGDCIANMRDRHARTE